MRGSEIQVWSFRLDLSPEILVALQGFLSPEERRRADRFRFALHRDRFVAARGRLREILSIYLGVPPAEVSFAYGPEGKPRPAHDSDLRFNLSHSEDEALLAVCLGRELGIDLERIRPDVEHEAIARGVFSPSETAALLALPRPARQAAFFDVWTRKEAFVKAKGGGLHIPLDDFDVPLDAAGPARLLRTAWDPREAGRWWVQAVGAPPGFFAAIVVEGLDRPRVSDPFQLERLTHLPSPF